MKNSKFCCDLLRYERFLTREVKIGGVPLGAKHPIRIQSMTTTDTMNTEATVKQCIRMIESGCDYIRITAPSLNEARNLELIKKELRQFGFETPLIADIHFTPNAAEFAARVVEKVRINPGNYADKKKFESIEYTDIAYQAELDRIRNRFVPLIKVCKEYGTAMRIGTNHGSLSDRILSRYGDTPLGMVESAMEFLRICEDEGFHQVVLSMKASNPKIMVEAYRLLVNHMMMAGMNFPLHLGVTEAGDGEDGRIKSALGIGTLLEDGLGDTVRVSLTEDPEFEAPVARALVERYLNRSLHHPIKTVIPVNFNSYEPFTYDRRKTASVLNVGGQNPPRVIIALNQQPTITREMLAGMGYRYAASLDKWHIGDAACDYLFTGNQLPDFELPGTLGIICNPDIWKATKKDHTYPLFTLPDYLLSEEKSKTMNFVRVNTACLTEDLLSRILADNTVVLVFETDNAHGFAEQRALFMILNILGCNKPVIIKRDYKNTVKENILLHASTDIGGLLLDGFGDGVWMNTYNNSSPEFDNTVLFGILQGTRTRISKTEYISCPSCGRTLFDLQETTAKIRMRTSHLKGVKIGIMGCIVNGPGEMADADYGYVGVGVGKITLYKGKEVIKKNIPSESAVDELIELIKINGDWVDEPPLPV